MLVSIRRIAARTARMAIRSCALKSCSNGLETASLNLRRQYSAQEDICSSIKASSRTRRRKMGSVAHNVPPPSPFPPSCYRSGQKKKKEEEKKGMAGLQSRLCHVLLHQPRLYFPGSIAAASRVSTLERQPRSKNRTNCASRLFLNSMFQKKRPRVLTT